MSKQAVQIKEDGIHVDASMDKAPCYLSNEESSSWTTGVEHGASEMYFALQAYFKQRGDAETAQKIADAVKGLS